MKRVKLSEKTVLDPGYRDVYAPARDTAAAAPRLKQYQRGQRVRMRTRVERSAGLPEAALIRLMQKSGVGRPSTYAAALEALRQHEYVEEADGRLRLNERGRRVLAFLKAHYPFLTEIEFSAEVETRLDRLAEGKQSYRGLLAELWQMLQGENMQ